MIRRPVRRLLDVGLRVALLVYAVQIVHDFYTYVDRAIYVSVDDAEAAIAYAIATRGRYSFLPSPVLFDMSRLHGQFNYGPWYFYVAAALIELFGYSLTLIRSIHLWVIVGCIAVAIAWFRGRDRFAAPALAGFGLLYFFDALEWPMARPDSFVAAFAVLLVVCVGLAWRRSQARWWLFAGLAASCGAFTHLVAISLVASVAALFVLWAIDRQMPAMRPAIALLAGLFAGGAMFYGSFGFAVATQMKFLAGYRTLTASSDGYWAAMGHHVHIAFGAAPRTVQFAVWISLLVAWVMIVRALLGRSARRDLVLADVLPPTMVWTLYLLSNGLYTNYHSGYAILHHVMFFWTAAAILWVTLTVLAETRPLANVLFATAVMALVLAQGVRQIQWQRAEPSLAQKAEHHTAFADYASHVVGAIPAGARAWGSVFFGIESPDRVQLIQYGDAAVMVEKMEERRRSAFAPDFLIWGYPENRDDSLAVLNGGQAQFASLPGLAPGVRYRLASLVYGAPYGVTRVYARASDGDAQAEAPSAAAYDDVHQRWLRRAAPVPVAFNPVAALALQIGESAASSSNVATSTVAADVPPGRYLIKVSIVPGRGTARRMIAATSWTVVRQATADLSVGPKGDFAPYSADDRVVYLLSAHPGGRLYVSQFDSNDGAAIESVALSRMLGISPEESLARSTPLPDISRWIPMPGVRMTLAGGVWQVEGDASPGGYQLYSPLIPATPGELIEADAPSRVLNGELCAGILDARGRWLVSATEWREQFDFHADATAGFRVGFANCHSGTDSSASRFTLRPGAYVRHGTTTYSDRMVAAALERTPSEAGASERKVRFPDQPFITVTPSWFDYRAPTVGGAGDGWVIVGHVGDHGEFLLRGRPRFMDPESRLLVAGRIERGGLSLGLLRDGAWVSRSNVAERGDFVAVLAPPAGGVYAIAIAPGPGSTDLDASLTRVQILPAIRPAK